MHGENLVNILEEDAEHELQGFSRWSRSVARMLPDLWGWRNALEEPEYIISGDKEGKEFRALLLSIMDDWPEELEAPELSRSDVCDRAREAGLLLHLIGEQDSDMKHGDKVKFGKRFGKYANRVFRKIQPITFLFAKTLSRTDLSANL